MNAVSSDIKFRQPIHHLHRLQPHGHHPQEQFQRILRVAHGFGGPEVGVVGDAAVLVGGDGLSLHDPFEGGFAVDDVVVGGGRDVFQGDVFVVNDGALVIHVPAGGVLGLAELHLGDAVTAVFGDGGGAGGFFLGHAGMPGHGLIVQMPMGEIAAGLGEGAEIRKNFHRGCKSCSTRSFMDCTSVL